MRGNSQGRRGTRTELASRQRAGCSLQLAGRGRGRGEGWGAGASSHESPPPAGWVAAGRQDTQGTCLPGPHRTTHPHGLLPDGRGSPDRREASDPRPHGREQQALGTGCRVPAATPPGSCFLGSPSPPGLTHIHPGSREMATAIRGGTRTEMATEIRAQQALTSADGAGRGGRGRFSLYDTQRGSRSPGTEDTPTPTPGPLLAHPASQETAAAAYRKTKAHRTQPVMPVQLPETRRGLRRAGQSRRSVPRLKFRRWI